MDRFFHGESVFRCPVCEERLAVSNKSFLCANRHCFDISSRGYVNFIRNMKLQKNYDRQFFQNRRTVLEHGLYSHILHEVASILEQMEFVKRVLDAGCGEGYYARCIGGLTKKEILAFDLSKESVQLAAKEDVNKAVKWFVADLAQLPILDHSVDCIFNIFSPANYREFRRVLTQGGYLIKAVPGSQHLKEVRTKARDYLKHETYSNRRIVNYFSHSCSIVSQQEVSATLHITPEEREAILHMTPLLFHVDKDKIDWSDMDTLTIEAEILVGQMR